MKPKLTIDQRIEVARITASLFDTAFPELGKKLSVYHMLKVVEKNQSSHSTKECGTDDFRNCYAWLFDVVASKITDESGSL